MIVSSYKKEEEYNAAKVSMVYGMVLFVVF
jgi:hypothetical protein